MRTDSQCNKPDTEGQTLCDSTDLRFLEESGSTETESKGTGVGKGENESLIGTEGQFGKMTMSGLRGQPLSHRAPGPDVVWDTHGWPAVRKGTDVQKGTRARERGQGETSLSQSGFSRGTEPVGCVYRDLC